MKSTENIKKETLASFSVLLKSKIEDFVIRDKDAFITLKAESSKEANDLENLKKECEEKVKQTDKSKEIVIDVPPPEFALCDSSDEENIKNQDEENIKNQDEKKDIVLSEYVNNDLPEFAL